MDIEIFQNHEYRIEINENQKYKVMVVAGLAEINGQELINDKWYVLSNINAGIFTFTGALIRVDGEAEMQYLTKSAMASQIFTYFDRFYQQKAFDKNIMVLGHGRTTFCATFINYMLRMHIKSIYTEIDPGKGNIFPGCLSSMIVEQFYDHTEKFKLNNPKCMYFGNTEIENIDLYDKQLEALFEIIDSKMKGYMNLILTPEFDNEKTNEIIKKYKIDEVVIVGNERMFHKINFGCNKIFIENNCHIIENNVFRSINTYFNGACGQYSPSSFIIKQKWNVVRIGEEHVAPESALPIGTRRKVDKLGINSVELIENSVLGISEAKTEDEIITSPVSGFLVCLDANKFRVFCTQPKLPKGLYLIQGNLKFTGH